MYSIRGVREAVRHEAPLCGGLYDQVHCQCAVDTMASTRDALHIGDNVAVQCEGPSVVCSRRTVTVRCKAKMRRYNVDVVQYDVNCTVSITRVSGEFNVTGVRTPMLPLEYSITALISEGNGSSQSRCNLDS